VVKRIPEKFQPGEIHPKPGSSVGRKVKKVLENKSVSEGSGRTAVEENSPEEQLERLLRERNPKTD